MIFNIISDKGVKKALVVAKGTKKFSVILIPLFPVISKIIFSMGAKEEKKKRKNVKIAKYKHLALVCF